MQRAVVIERRDPYSYGSDPLYVQSKPGKFVPRPVIRTMILPQKMRRTHGHGPRGGRRTSYFPVELASSRSAWYNVKIATKHNVKQDEEEERVMQTIKSGKYEIFVAADKPSPEALYEFCKKILELAQKAEK